LFTRNVVVAPWICGLGERFEFAQLEHAQSALGAFDARLRLLGGRRITVGHVGLEPDTFNPLG
jgi:hypothetical protein